MASQDLPPQRQQDEGYDGCPQRPEYGHSASHPASASKRLTDPGWISVEITYGLYLSNHAILDGVDTELVVLSGIMIQNLGRETGWHLRGTRRIGVSHDDVELIQQCVSLMQQVFVATR